MTFGQTHFGGLDLGDRRREQRLPQLVDRLCQHPGGTLPDKLSEPCDLRAFYRLMNAEKVTHQAVLSTHHQVTRQTIAEHVQESQTVLILHDATELDFTSKTTLLDDLGQIGQGTRRGYICHNSLAVLADTKATLGLASQILHHRADVPKTETAKQKRERADRESRLWVQGAKQSGGLPEGSVRVVDVSDSLSDTFEYMAFESQTDRNFVLRAKENRKLVEPIGGESYLLDAARTSPSISEWELTIPAKPGQKSRTADLQMSLTNVTINPPTRKTGEYAEEPLSLGPSAFGNPSRLETSNRWNGYYSAMFPWKRPRTPANG